MYNVELQISYCVRAKVSAKDILRGAENGDRKNPEEFMRIIKADMCPNHIDLSNTLRGRAVSLSMRD